VKTSRPIHRAFLESGAGSEEISPVAVLEPDAEPGQPDPGNQATARYAMANMVFANSSFIGTGLMM
jgi:hypothetical protein